MTVAQILKFLHILLAIIAVGANATYGVWLSLARREPAQLRFALRGIKRLDDRIANPAYGLLFVTGAAMVYLTDLPWETPWLATAVILYVLVIAVGLFGYTPALRRQIRAVESAGPESAAYRRAATTAMRLGLVTMVLVLAIVFLMAVKPPLW